MFLELVSISSAFYACLFVQKCFAQLFSNYSLTGLVIFCPKNICAKAARKMMKLTPARKSSLKVKKYFLNSSNKVGDKSKIYFSFHVSAFRIISLFISFPEKLFCVKQAFWAFMTLCSFFHLFFSTFFLPCKLTLINLELCA